MHERDDPNEYVSSVLFGGHTVFLLLPVFLHQGTNCITNKRNNYQCLCRTSIPTAICPPHPKTEGSLI